MKKRMLIIVLFSIFYFSASLFQNYLLYSSKDIGIKLILINVIFLLTSLIVFIKYYKVKEVYEIIIKVYNDISVPKSLKIIFTFILIGQFFYVFIANKRYPFLDAGMYRQATKSKDYNKEVLSAKYYYNNKDGEIEILDLRKEHIPFLKKYKDLDLSEFWTISPSFNNAKGVKNYNFLKSYFKDYTDTLKIGIHRYNFDTHKLDFITDIEYVKANRDNTTYQFYHPIFND